MKKWIGNLCFFMVLLGCTDASKLTFEPVKITNGTTCADCPNVQISLPKALNGTKIANTINRALEEEVIAFLSFDHSIEKNTIETAISSFSNSYQEIRNKFPDDTANWEAKLNGSVVFENENLVSIALHTFLFTGGAHGYGATTLLNFDKQKGNELENSELFEDEIVFKQFVEAKFREQENIPKDVNINATGFMFGNDTFHLPENMGYSEQGIALLYNQYEIASYADGPIQLTLPYAEANTFLKRKVQN
ncbi:MAG: DUF3298 domain-containing protein [Bacteroidota bacterium]